MCAAMLIPISQPRSICLTLRNKAADSNLPCTVDFDPLAGSKVKGINYAHLVVESHPFHGDETIIMVSTSSGEATIWHSVDSRCRSVHACRSVCAGTSSIQSSPVWC